MFARKSAHARIRAAAGRHNIPEVRHMYLRRYWKKLLEPERADALESERMHALDKADNASEKHEPQYGAETLLCRLRGFMRGLRMSATRGSGELRNGDGASAESVMPQSTPNEMNKASHGNAMLSGDAITSSKDAASQNVLDEMDKAPYDNDILHNDDDRRVNDNAEQDAAGDSTAQPGPSAASALSTRAKAMLARMRDSWRKHAKRRKDRHASRAERKRRKRAELAALTPAQRALRRKRKWKRAGLWTLGIAVGMAVALAFALDVGSWTWLDEGRLYGLDKTTFMYDSGGVEVAGLNMGEDRIPVDTDALPEHVRMAFVAAEDARFFSHHGIDIRRIGGAIINNLRSGGYSQGASTITQQLIKLTHLSPKKTLSRKANEAVLALLLEMRHSKDEILGMYMNTVYFGHGAYGIEAAARAYFSKSASDLDIAQSALMAAIVKSPSGYAPHIAPERAKQRRDWVLGEMLELGFISETQHDEAAASPIVLNERVGDMPDCGWYIDYALGEAERLLELETGELLTGGYRIYTEMDAPLQREAQLAMAKADFPADSADGTRCQGAMCAVDNSSGALRAIVGGREYEVRRGLNRAADVRRQPGSAIKPLAVYAPALDRFGYLPTSFLSDVRTDFGGWSPRNAGDKYRGIVTLRQTAASSINVPTVELLERIGVRAGIDFLNGVGIETDARDEVLPLALGAMTYGVSPLDLCGAYAAVAAGGVYREPYAVRRIEDASGEIVYSRDQSPRRVMSEKSAYMLTSMLRSAVDGGTAWRLNGLDMDVAAKTGTAAISERETGISGNRDIWMAAYTPRLTLTAWMGFDRTDNAHHIPESAGGSNHPALLIRTILESDAAAGYARGAFALPEGLREVMIDGWALEEMHSVLLAGEDTPADKLMREVFTPGTLPTRISTLFDAPLPVYDLSVKRDEAGLPRVEFTCPQAMAQYRIYRDAGNGRVLIGTLQGEEGQRLALTDVDAPDAQRIRYDAVPYAPAQDEEGAAASAVLERSLWDELGRWLGGGRREQGDAGGTMQPAPEWTYAPAATDAPMATYAPGGLYNTNDDLAEDVPGGYDDGASASPGASRAPDADVPDYGASGNTDDVGQGQDASAFVY